MLTALVLGGAACVWDDAEAALNLFTPDLVIAVNDIGTRWEGRLTHYATLHPDKMAGWRNQRMERGLAPAGQHIGHEVKPGIDRAVEYRWPGQPASGSSGLFAVKIAMDEGCDRIVLAGVPMHPEGGHIANGRVFSAECHVYLPAWQWVLPILRDKVRSMSGWTAESLGRPDHEWFSDQRM